MRTPSPSSHPAGAGSLPCPPEEIDRFIAEPPPGLAAALEALPGPFLVLGAGGKMGLHLTLMLDRALREQGRRDRVVAVSRFHSLRGTEEFARFGLETMPCDLEKPEELERLPEAGVVYYLAGIKFGTTGAPELLRRLNVEVPRKVADRFRRARIAAFSSGAVYPFLPVASGGATEGTPPDPVGDYALSCLQREQAFREAGRRYGTAVSLLRLNYSVEFRYGVLLDIATKVHEGAPIELGVGYVNVIWQGDAIAYALRSATIAGIPAVPINLTGPDTLSVRALAHRFGEEFGRAPVFTGAEGPTALLSNAARSHALFGPPRVGVDELIAWTAAWIRAGGRTWGKPTRFESRSGNY